MARRSLALILCPPGLFSVCLDGFFLASSHSLKTSTVSDSTLVAGVNVTMNSLFVLTTCTGCTSPLALCQLGSRPASTLNESGRKCRIAFQTRHTSTNAIPAL